MDIFVEISVKWNGSDYTAKLLPTNTVGDLKSELFKMTNVMPERQKLLGLKTNSSQALTNDTLIDELKYKPGTKIMMMGTIEEKIEIVNTKPDNLPEVIDDFDIDKNVEDVHLQHREENLAKISKRVREYKINILNEPRPNKKLLVLDIDYTLFDHVSHAEKGIYRILVFLFLVIYKILILKF
jgi:ubiquitin-like domain-containing CTD phosphatase 1